MTRIYFSHLQDSDCLVLNAYKVDVNIFFNKGSVSHIDIEGREFDAKEDILYGLVVKVPTGKTVLSGDSYHLLSLQEIINEAESQYGSIVQETERENREESNMIDEVSSPYLSGRI
jgi:hypothetical protein